ncbi:hypothetical protein HPB52_024711 [Rhipicephalus sanguineus]|uniref:Peptidase M13 N-terminal domain-containing protein n=1 Tax=Rhipicephalus sanguineus TaxID=34632 RepID=A0A9D4SMM5_RHISA|nr:hypothetical protein HPB52_024711 [Rhipicephalus sanguineus]
MALYKDAELLSLIAWSFVQLLSPAVDYRLLENRYDRGVAIYRPYFCERLVETAYRFLVIALSSVSLFSRAERAAVNGRFDSLVSAAVEMVNASEWLDAESRQLAAEKLLSTHLHLYDAASSFVKVAVGAVTEHLYYAGGTRAMSYGGLGFSMALQLVAALDRQGIRWHPDGTLGESFLSK